MAYDNIKIHKNSEFHPLFRRYIFEKQKHRGIQIDPFLLPPSLFRVKMHNILEVQK